MIINLKNIEEILFYDKKIWSILPEFRHYFDQWALAKRVPGMSSLGKKSVMDLLFSLKENHLEKLQIHFNEFIFLDKIDSRLVSNCIFEEDNYQDICEYSGYKDFCLTKSKDKVSVSFWR